MARLRTVKQKAALRKAQLASARKRRKSTGKSSSGKWRRRAKRGAKYAAVAGVAYLVATQRGRLSRVGGRHARVAATRKSDHVTATTRVSSADHKPTPNPSRGSARRTEIIRSAREARTRARRAETRSRQLQKVTERSLYNAGLPSNVGGRTFVAGFAGTYRR